MRNGLNGIISRADGMVSEGIDNTAGYDIEDYEEAIVAAEEAAELEKEIEESAEVIDDVNELVTTIEDKSTALIENLETMSQTEVAMAVAEVKTLAGVAVTTTSDDGVVGVDAEAYGQDYKRAATADMEAISDSLKKAWETFIGLFAKMFRAIGKLIQDSIMWFNNTSKKTKALLKEVTEKGALKENIELKDVKKAIGSKLALICYPNGHYDGFVTAGEGFATIVKSSVGLANKADRDTVDKIFEGVVRTKSAAFTSVSALDEADFIKLSRIDGAGMKYLVATEVSSGIIAYKSYESIRLTDVAIASIKVNAIPGLDVIKKALDGVSKADTLIKSTSDKLYAELKKAGDGIKKDIETVKPADSSFKLAWAKVTGGTTFEQMNASQKASYLRNKASFMAKWNSDVIYGAAGLAKEVNAVASIFLGCYVPKKK